MPIKSFLARRAGQRGVFRRKPRNHIASRVVIRKPVTWRTRLIWGGLAVLALLLGGGSLFVAGQYTAGHDSLSSALRLRELTQDNHELRAQAAKLSDTLATVTTQLRIEQGARQTMAGQIAKLEEERERLNRDLAQFENLFPSNGADGQPAIRGFQLEPTGAAGGWRYRLLIMRPGRTPGTFSGEVQLSARYRLDGKEIAARTRESGNIAESVTFERYQRVEGAFQAPSGAKLLGVTARLMENGRPVAESAIQP